MKSINCQSASGVGLLCLLAGCSSVLGLDDFEDAADGSTTSSVATTSTSVGATTSSTSAVATSSAATTSSSSSSTSAGGGGSTSDGGGGSTSDGGGGSTSDGGGGSTSDGGGGSTSDGGGGSTSDGGGGGVSTTNGSGGEGGTIVVGPTVVVTSASVAQNGTTNSSRATFLFGSSPPGSAVRYECSLDGAAFADCTTGSSGAFDQGLLPGGAHALTVRGEDAGGNVGPDLVRSWTIEAVGTTINALRTHTIPEDTLVQISSNVRSTVVVNVQGEQNIFVQDVNGGSTAAAFSAARNHGIRTIARTFITAPQMGRALTVVGTFRTIDGSDTISAAEYVVGSQMAAYSALSTNDTVEVDDEALESVYVRVSGEIPSNFNCSSGCTLPGGQFCLEGCGDCRPLDHVDFSTTGTFDWGFYSGVLVGPNRRALWFIDSSEGGDDICL